MTDVVNFTFSAGDTDYVTKLNNLIAQINAGAAALAGLNFVRIDTAAQGLNGTQKANARANMGVFGAVDAATFTQLTIAGNYATVNAISAGNAYYSVAALGQTPGVDSFDFLNDGSNAYVWNRANVPLLFGTNAIERFRIEPSGNLLPGSDNSYNLGSASRGLKEIFCDNGTINTSDARKKTPVTPLTAAEIAAAADLARNIGAFRFLASVEAKGDDARLHIGMTVQRAIEIMTDHGLEAMRYSFICHDAWDDEYIDHPAIEAADAVEARPAEYRSETYDEVVLVDGEPVTLQRTRLVEVAPAVAARPAVEAQPARRELVREAGDKYAFRVHELLLFIARGMEARIAALEGK